MTRQDMTYIVKNKLIHSFDTLTKHLLNATGTVLGAGTLDIHRKKFPASVFNSRATVNPEGVFTRGPPSVYASPLHPQKQFHKQPHQQHRPSACPLGAGVRGQLRRALGRPEAQQGQQDLLPPLVQIHLWTLCQARGLSSPIFHFQLMTDSSLPLS